MPKPYLLTPDSNASAVTGLTTPVNRKRRRITTERRHHAAKTRHGGESPAF
jgi:hypothetical protein